jgi:hypothetical protein
MMKLLLQSGNAFSLDGRLLQEGTMKTEEEWLECDSPEEMLKFLAPAGKRMTGRQWRLLTCACCRHIWHLLTDKRSRRAVEMEEWVADGGPITPEVLEARRAAVEVGSVGGAVTGARFDAQTMRAAAYWVWRLSETDQAEAWDRERASQCDLLRDIIGNPFREVSIDQQWRTPLVVAMAKSIYDERRFEDVPILADALEDVGCADPVLLDHLRGPGPHVRGCHVLDLLRNEGVTPGPGTEPR